MAQKRDQWSGTVKFMFQPAEEGLGGAGKMIEAGLLGAAPRPDYALALHVWSEIDAGVIGLSPGPVMAAADEFRVTITGKGGHGAMPHQTTDAVVVAAQVVGALQTVVSRNIKPLESAVITVGSLHSGQRPLTSYRVKLAMEGTLRSFDATVRTGAGAALPPNCRNSAAGFWRPGPVWNFFPGYPPTINNEEVTARLQSVFESVAGKDNVRPFEPTMGAEDMSLVLERIPGCYFFIGGRSQATESVWPHHHPRFNIDESALDLGTRAMVAAVEELLQS